MLSNPYTLDQTIEQLKYFIGEINDRTSIELLEKTLQKAAFDKVFSMKMENTFLRGSTLECRDLLSGFGEYCPAFPNPDISFSERMDYMSAVNFIDSALYHIKRDETEEVLSWWGK